MTVNELKKLEKETFRSIRKHPDSQETLKMVGKWFWSSEVKLRESQRFVESFIHKHLNQSNEDFTKLLNK